MNSAENLSKSAEPGGMKALFDHLQEGTDSRLQYLNSWAPIQDWKGFKIMRSGRLATLYTGRESDTVNYFQPACPDLKYKCPQKIIVILEL